VIIDCEHGNHDDGDMHDVVNTIASEGVSPIVRIRAGDYGLIKRALDCGAQWVARLTPLAIPHRLQSRTLRAMRETRLTSSGIMIPMVNTVQDAQNIIKWSKFPPMGVRGQGSSFSAISSGQSLTDYVKNANSTLLTIVQIETPEAVSNVDAIAALPGVDALFIGPNDLALSMLGYVPARGDEPEFVEALAKVKAACEKHGKYPGILGRGGAHAKEMSEKGWTLMGLGSDVRALQTAMMATVAAAKGKA